jgi:L-fucose mutarotase
MLKNIDSLLNAELLFVLKSMGHGDDLIISDTNFPADSVARHTAYGKLLRVDADAPRVARAILSLFPLDSFVPAGEAAARMEIVEKPNELPDVQKEMQIEIDRAEGKSWPMGSIERFAFYETAKKSYCVVQAHERRFYGCFLFKKGVIAPDVKLGT